MQQSLLWVVMAGGWAFWLAGICVGGESAAGRAIRHSDVVLTVKDPGGQAGAVGAPVSVPVERLSLGGRLGGQLRLVELDAAGQGVGDPIAVQLDAPGVAAEQVVSQGTLWWLLPPGKAETRRYKLLAADEGQGQATQGQGLALPPAAASSVPAGTPSAAARAAAKGGAVMRVVPAGREDWFLLCEGDRPILRYNHGAVPAPPGIDPKYTRGDYIHPLFGLEGELLTDDYPKDHPHHRGVSWSWPVTRWKDQVRDIWAVVGVWSRPVAVRSKSEGPVFAALSVGNVWKWGDEVPLVRETVVIRAFRQTAAGRFVDIEVSLEGLEEGVAIGGRPHAGYGGFGLRAAPTQEQKITLHRDPAAREPRRSWIDYSGRFQGAGRPSGLAIFEHPSNPGYPSELLQYPQLNYVMPAFPGQTEVPLPRGRTLVLRHRLWIHRGEGEEALGAVWATYANPPQVTVQER